jgi:hypothetical protein
MNYSRTNRNYNNENRNGRYVKNQNTGYKNTNSNSDTSYRVYNNNNNNNLNENSQVSVYVKEQLINYIYSTVELGNFKYKIVEYEEDMELLTKDKYYISANYSGSNCLLVFIKIRDKYFSYLVDRKTLSYDKHHINYDTVKIIQVNLRLDESIYKGTIFDGIFIQTPRNKSYIITDAYHFRGNNTCNDKIQYKIMNIVAYLTANLKEDPIINNMKLTVNKLYDIDQIDTLINEVIPQQKNPLIRGITFYPEISGNRIIFMFNNEIKMNGSQKNNKNLNINSNINQNINSNINLNSNSNINSNTKINTRYINKTNEPVIATFELRKTEDTDVYKLYIVETIKNNDRTIMKSKRMGIALIPTIECSMLCRNIFAKNTKTRILMKCKFINDKNKWQPIEEDTVSPYPSNITDIESKMDIIEENVSDNET